jgi:AcrR family transcriptional regulator
MTRPTSPTKSETTRQRILDCAYALACKDGIEGLSLGVVASAADMSKSGVFIHFGSRQDMQLSVLDEATRRFVAHVLVPGVGVDRGVPRLRRLVERWFDWGVNGTDGGCIFLAAAAEYDDRPGALRDAVAGHHTRWRRELARAARIAVECGHLRADSDVEQLVFEIYALALMVHHEARFGDRSRAEARGMAAFDRRIQAESA